MLLKNHKIYENKLSEQLNKDNPYKQKLIEMETPSDKSPIYSTLSIGLLIYVWMFLFALVYQKAYGYECAILVVLFTTFCFAMVYKKPYLLSQEPKYTRNIYIILFITMLFSVVISFADRGNLTAIEQINVFLFFLEINDKSYIALSILAFLSLGIAITYHKSPYEIYRAFYSENKTYNYEKNEEIRINKFQALSIVLILGFIPLISLTLNYPKDSYELLLKSLAIGSVFYFPTFLAHTFTAKKYLKTFKKAKDFDNQVHKKGK